MSIQVTAPTDQFNRPADVVAYAVGDLVANSTVGGSVVPLKLQMPSQGVSMILRRLGLRKSSATLTAASFRVHLFRTAPVMTVGDNAAMVLPGDGTGYLGYVDVTFDQAFAAGAVGYGSFPTDSHIRMSPNDGEFLYALIEARGAYAPANAELFHLGLQVRTA